MSLPSHPSTTSPPPPEPVVAHPVAVHPVAVHRSPYTRPPPDPGLTAGRRRPSPCSSRSSPRCSGRCSSPGPAGAEPAPAAGSFVSLAPSRILDTRTGLGAPAGHGPHPGSVALTVLGRGGIPTTGVGAVVLNVTVTDTSRPGYVTVYPTGLARPTASNLNFAAGQSVPNLVVVKVGSDGQVTLFSDSARPVDLVATSRATTSTARRAVPGR